MALQEENIQEEKPTDIFIEKDVLGLDKQATNTTPVKASPNRIFIVLAIIVIIAIAYGFFSGH